MKPVPYVLDRVGSNLVKKVSTSGIQYVLNKSRNSVLSLPPATAKGSVVISIENMTDLLATFRCRSAEFGIQSQIQLGPNVAQFVYLPFAEDYLLSTDQELKISEISFLQNYFPESKFQIFKTPAPSIQVTSSSKLLISKDRKYVTSGYVNIFFKQSFFRDTFLLLEVKGNGVVAKFGDLRLKFDTEAEYLIPASRILQTLSLGASNSFEFSLTRFDKIHEKPGYVPPEAALWSFENTAI